MTHLRALRALLTVVAVAGVGAACGSSPPPDADGADAAVPSAAATPSAPPAPPPAPPPPSPAPDAAPADAAPPADASPADAASPDVAPPVLPCNGAPELCGRRYDQVAYVTSHNAMSNSDALFIAPNQSRSIARQLAAGVRGLMLDTYSFLGGTYLCHGSCALGATSLTTGLSDIRAFLDANPREVVTIIFESYITAAETQAAFASAGLEPRLHAQPRTAAWPTLAELIALDHRVVVFTDSGGGAYPWYHAVWSYAFETPYAYKTAADMRCVLNRGSASNGLFILNHFLTNPLASEALARTVNFNPAFGARAAECQVAFGKLPNFVTVDFESIGDVVPVVRTLNGLP